MILSSVRAASPPGDDQLIGILASLPARGIEWGNNKGAHKRDSRRI
jgi:hypothetical protein